MFSEIKITHEFAHNLSNQTLASKNEKFRG